jgi:hypothetical protein
MQEKRDELFEKLNTLHRISSVCNGYEDNCNIALWIKHFKTHELYQNFLAELSKLAGKQVVLQDDTDIADDMRRCVRTIYLPRPNRHKDSFTFFLGNE